MGIKAVVSHMQSQKHKTRETIARSHTQTPAISTFCISAPAPPPQTVRAASTDLRVAFGATPTLKAEVLWILNTVVKHQSYNSNEGIGDLIGLMFPDPQIASTFTAGRDKTAYITRFGPAPFIRNERICSVNKADFVLIFETLNHANKTHSTPSYSDTASSLTDTISLSSSDSDLREHGIPAGRSRSSKEDMGSSAAKEMVEDALNRKPGGEDILEEYRGENSLSHRTRRQLVNILASDMTERHGRFPSRQQKEKYALGIITVFPSLKDPFSPKGYVNQDFLLLFGAETATKLLEKWDTSFKPKVIKEAKQLTPSTDLCHLLKAAEKLAENGKRRTKISPRDAADKMVHFHKSCCSIDEHLQERDGKPYILAVGRTQSRIDTFYIAVDKQLIPCQATSSLGAFDELFKSHYVFNLNYDESLVHFYSFVQTTIFNIDATSTDESPRVRELRAKILNENNV
ncbi:uncharacterized protein LOC129107955 [Anoplopoma fimbria]|uniref:uncharacterized protein LOC129107955 n=1 Tax=Anoplopoma fimbria TaxID=229290 RepID=UPI0023EBC126|nr:uncharacterized protein LOC129107955 [Anoplopoma fimbria]